MDRYVCIHGHFYQPPRENPWLEEVELQDSAYPYHDWNERVTYECYAANTASRILDSELRIVDITNNYSRISFNFGPTLLSWMQRKIPDIYQAILDADTQSRARFSGHGSAIAQAYNHMIMPLANDRDKRTQVLWGITDFRARFGRDPEGMWLPETAVDLTTLDIMAEQGIRFTILGPHQAKRVRKLSEKRWKDVKGEKVDPKCAYRCQLPSGKVMNIFFYDGPVSRDIAFGGLLANGEEFAKRIMGAFSEDTTYAQCVNLASDGETFGHHHRFGDMALAYCLHHIETHGLARLTIYGEFLERHPPEYEVEIYENSSWSCFHGIERWRNNCGCASSAHADWTQEWRAPLREAMDWLRDALADVYGAHARRYLTDPWRARDDYIAVVLDRSLGNVNAFLARQTVPGLSHADKVTVLNLLEMQRCAMLMYTSCGWFFDEISRIEPVQIMHYASRAMQIARDLEHPGLEEEYLKILRRAPSNIKAFATGADVYRSQVQPAQVDLLRVGAHYAISSLFQDRPESIKTYCFTADNNVYERREVGRQKLSIGKAHVRSDITWEETDISFAVLYIGEHNLIGGVCDYIDPEKFVVMEQEIRESFERSDLSEVILRIDKHFQTHHYSLWHLFKDEQRAVLDHILNDTIAEIESSFRQINERHSPIMQVMRELHIPLPRPLAVTAEMILNQDIRAVLEVEPLDVERLKGLLDELTRWSFSLDRVTFEHIARQRVNRFFEQLAQRPADLRLMELIGRFLQVLRTLSFDLNVWRAQNRYFAIRQERYHAEQEKARSGEEQAKRWLGYFDSLGVYLKIHNA